MTMPKPEQTLAEKALAELIDPYTGLPLLQTAHLELTEQSGRPLVQVEMRYPSGGMKAELTDQIQSRLGQLYSDPPIAVNFDWRFDGPERADAIPGVRYLIAVASGKGGVGKSATSVNLAFALAAEGAKVGILDADIYGPSQGQMLGVDPETRPALKDEKWFVPIIAHGLQSMSMSYLVTKHTPLVWRGPMVSGALRQMLEQTLWSELDYLIIDMPPGTGDIQLTLTQSAAVSAAVVVTTPQDLALLDARRAIEMFIKVKVPVLGMIENMSFYDCPGCGKRADLFGSGGGQQMADDYGISLLAQLPLDPELGRATDSGNSPLLSEPEGKLATIYRAAARRLAAGLYLHRLTATDAPVIAIDNG